MNVTIQQVGPDIKVPMNEFDGKVTYGEKRMAMGMYCLSLCYKKQYYMSAFHTGSNYENHVQQMVPVVAELAALESRAQIAFLKTYIAEH